MVTGGQALVRQLLRHGVRHVFGVPGVQLDWAVDAFNDVRGQIELIVPRHEQATSYMADGYGRTTGSVGVCMVVPGPGVLNAMSGLATGYACSAPMMCIAGQIASPGIGNGFGMLHEVNDQSGMLANVTKWSGLARTPQDVARHDARCFACGRVHSERGRLQLKCHRMYCKRKPRSNFTNCSRSALLRRRMHPPSNELRRC